MPARASRPRRSRARTPGRTTERPRVLVVGAGVIGLTCAVRLAEQGHEVAVLARDLPLETTSATAAALWYPYHAYPPERVDAWSARSYEKFVRLAETEPEAGVRIRWGTELLRSPEPDPRPAWLSALPTVERPARIPDGYATARRFPGPVVDMAIYLPWLASRLEALGGTVTRHAFEALPGRAPVVVDACGIAARKLADDLSVTPTRGQIVVLEQIGLTEWWLDQSDPGDLTYVVPRLHEIVVGGTAQDGDWTLQPDGATAEHLLRKAIRLVPSLARADVVRHKVGLRPARPTVRLEAEARPGHEDRLLVHCYGHGGSGVTTSWGCADEVAELVDHATTAP